MGAGQLSLWGAVGSKISECIGNTDYTKGLHCRWFICSYTTFLMKLKSEATRHLMALVHMHRLQNPAYYLKHIQGYITDHWGDKIMSHALQGCLSDRDIYWQTPPQEIYTTNYNAMDEKNIQTKEDAHVHTSFSITVGGQLLVSEFWCSQILLNRLPQSSNPEGCTPDLERLVFGPLIASPTNWIPSWGKVLASPWLSADMDLAISWQLIASVWQHMLLLAMPCRQGRSPDQPGTGQTRIAFWVYVGWNKASLQGSSRRVCKVRCLQVGHVWWVDSCQAHAVHMPGCWWVKWVLWSGAGTGTAPTIGYGCTGCWCSCGT